jgi:hypothetical protein
MTMRQRLVGAAQLLTFLFAAFFALAGPRVTGPVDAVTGNADVYSVSVNPTVGLADGSVVSIHAEAPADKLIYEVRAHICAPDRKINNTVDFGFTGNYCPNVPIGAGDFEQVASYPIGVTAGDIEAFRIGVGSVNWTTDRGFVHDLACGPGQACNLVVMLQVTEGTVFYTAPLCYGAGCPPEPGTPPPAEPPVETTPAAAPPAAAADQAPPSSGTGANGSSPSTPAETRVPGKSNPLQPARVAANSATVSEAQAASVTSPIDSSMGMRVFAAAIAGAIGGTRIFYVVNRARRSYVAP